MKILPLRLIIFASAAALILGGCGTYPQEITKAQWNRMSPAEKAKLRAEEARRTRDIERSYAKDGQVYSATIKDDQQNRERTPELTDPR